MNTIHKHGWKYGLIMASGLASLAVQGVGCYSKKRKASKLYKMKLSRIYYEISTMSL
jgi:hypothetical protein